MEVINIVSKLNLFEEHWSPKVIGELNGQHVKLAKLKGEFVWHNHADEDEMFYIIKGSLIIEFRDKTITLGSGEMIVIPAGIDHKPIAHEEVHVMLFEPASTKHTGDVEHKLTQSEHQYI